MKKQHRILAPKEVISFFEELFYTLKAMTNVRNVQNKIQKALDNLKRNPEKPTENIAISFSIGKTSYFAFYSDYKIEISDYNSFDSGFGIDHFQTNLFTYTFSETQESGDFMFFANEFLEKIKQKDFSEISISNEE